MSTLVIRVVCDDDSDLDWIKHRAIGAVESQVEESQEEGRFDGNVSVEWDTED